MKRHIHYLYFIVISILIILFSACKNEFPENYQPASEIKTLSISPRMLIAKADGCNLNIGVKSTNIAWKFTDIADTWISLVPMSGHESANVKLTVERNTNPSTGRTALWKFSNDDPDNYRTCTMSLSQEAPGYFVTAEENLIEVSASATTRTINISANEQWNAYGDYEWVTYITNENTLTLNIKENTTTFDKDREAIIYLQCGDAKSVVTIRQHPANISTKTNQLVFENTGGVYQLDVESDVSWSAATSQSWLSVSPSTGQAGKSFLSITALPNNSAEEQTANVYIIVGSKQIYQIPVRQERSYVTTEEASITFGFKASSKNILVSSNTEWQIISYPEFVTITPIGIRQGNDNLQISASMNESNLREGDIVIGVPNVTGLQQKIHIIQESAYIQTSPLTVSLGSTKDSQHKIKLNTNDDWTAHMLYGKWAKVSPEKGSGTAEITVTSEDNPTLNERVDTLIVDATIANSIKVATVQKGRFMNVDKGSVWFFENKGEDIISIRTDATFEVYSTVEWIKVNRNGNILSITVDELPEGNLRNGEIIIKMTGLTQGEYKLNIPIYQCRGTIFNVVCFTDDEYWDLTHNQQLKISVIGFGVDNNWSKRTSVKVEVDYYGEDANWNK